MIRCALGLAVVVTLGWLAVPAPAGDDGFKPIFNGKDLTGWKIFPDKAAKAFAVQDDALAILGKPAGYIYTDKSYRNYVLSFDWKYLKDGNSGVLVHIQGHKVWPRSLEVQGMQKQFGSIIPIGIKARSKVDGKAQKAAIKIGAWNATEIAVKDGRVDTKINGTPISTATILSDDVQSGPIGFQAEGSPLLLKNLKLKTLE